MMKKKDAFTILSRSPDGKIKEIVNHEHSKKFLRFVDINDKTRQLKSILIKDLLRDISGKRIFSILIS